MEKKVFAVTLEIEETNEDRVYAMIERLVADHRVLSFDIVDTEERHYEERIRYVENWMGHGEHFVFEGKWSDEEEWGLDAAFPLVMETARGDDSVTIGYNLIHYTALTKIRELMKLNIPFHFAKEGEDA